MYIKKNTVIPADFKITKCPPGIAAGKSIYQLEREEEHRLLTLAMKVPVCDERESDRQAKELSAMMEQQEAR